MIIVEDTGPPDAPFKRPNTNPFVQVRANHGSNSPSALNNLNLALL